MVLSPSRSAIAIAKTLPATMTKRIPFSFSPSVSTANGTQHTLGRVWRPRNSGPRNRSSSCHCHIARPRAVPRRMLIPKPAASRTALTPSASMSCPRYHGACAQGGAAPLGHGHPGPSGSPNAVRTFSIDSVESRTWLGAGKTHGLHPTTLYAPSQVASRINHTARRRRLPAIFGHLGVDTVDLVLDLLTD